MTVDEFIERYWGGSEVYDWQREIIECVVNHTSAKMLTPISGRRIGWVSLGAAINEYYEEHESER